MINLAEAEDHVNSRLGGEDNSREKEKESEIM